MEEVLAQFDRSFDLGLVRHAMDPAVRKLFDEDPHIKMVLGLGLGLVLALALALALTLILTLPLPLTLQVRAAEQRQKLYLPTSPYISLYLPASPCRCARPSRGRSRRTPTSSRR